MSNNQSSPYSTPDFLTLFALNAPQPSMKIYAVAFGRCSTVFMTILAIIGLVLVCDSTVAALHLVFSMARDSVLPGSK